MSNRMMFRDTQAVCSFIPRQLSIHGRTPAVLFFHGLSGLENACDDGLITKCVPELSSLHSTVSDC